MLQGFARASLQPKLPLPVPNSDLRCDAKHMAFFSALLLCGMVTLSPYEFVAKSSASMSAKALNSSAFPLGSSKNIVCCSPGCPSKRT